MPTEIIVPRLGWSMEEGAFVAWLKKDGEYVHPGDPLFSIEGDKAVQEIESIDSGFLRIATSAPKPGEPIRVGDILGYLLATKEEVVGPVTAIESVKPGVDSELKPAPPDEKPIAVPLQHSPGEQVTASRRRAITPRAL